MSHLKSEQGATTFFADAISGFSQRFRQFDFVWRRRVLLRSLVFRSVSGKFRSVVAHFTVFRTGD